MGCIKEARDCAVGAPLQIVSCCRVSSYLRAPGLLRGGRPFHRRWTGVPMLRDRRGFTIFELFVVLVIAGILFAFAYPRISKVAVTASLRGARGAMITAVNVAKSSGITSGKCSWVK